MFVYSNVFLAFSVLCLSPQTSFSLNLFVYLYVLWGIGASIGIRRCKTISVDVAVACVYYVMCVVAVLFAVAVCQCCGVHVVLFDKETGVCRFRLFKVSGISSG